jgi:YD repeat-containing protein
VETNGTLDQAAYLTGTNSELTYVPLAAGGTRESAQSYTYNSIGLQVSDSDQPDLSVPSESTCTDTEYAANTATGLTDLPESVTQDAGACNASGNGTGAMVRESEYFYDGGGLGAAPSGGNLTKTGQAVSDSGAAPIFAFTQATYDEYGRVLTSVNADGKTTTTAYTPVTGAEPVSVTVTDPMLLATTTAYDPARDLPVSVTQPDSAQTITSYDALGRPVAQWNPGNPDTGPADDTWSYTVSSAAPPVTTEQVLQPGGGYLTTQTLGDSLGNTRETQQETAGGGTDVTDYTYDQNGRQSMVSGPYYVTGPPTGTLIETAAAGLSAETAVSFDGDGRTVRQVLYDGTTEKWETDTSYGGGESTVTPPAGGTPETTWTNGLGQVTAIWQYHAGVPVAVTDPAADYDATAYTYNPGGELAGITDAAGNKWSYAYDLLGDQLTATDPDAGTTASSYDPAQLLTSVTDARGKTVSYAYDNDGRKNAEYDTTGGALETSSDELASLTWDTLAPGQLTSSTAYSGGASYTEEVTGYNAQGLPSGTATVIPSAQGALAGTYTQGYTYAPTGQETSYTDSAAGGLPAETVTLGYNTAGEQDSLTGASPYVNSLC